MRINLIDALLFLSMKILKSLDKRETNLKYFTPEQIKNILVVSSTAIGDTLLSTPAIRAVRERYPHAKITAHFNIKNLELFENNPHIDGIIPYYGGYKKFFKTIGEFRKHKFDLALIFHGNEPQATPMAYLSGARFILKWPIPKQYGFLLSNYGIDMPAEIHNIDVKLGIASLAGCTTNEKKMVLIPHMDDRRLVAEYMRDKDRVKEDIIIGFQVGAANKYKMWPSHNFVALGKKLLKDNVRIIVIGCKKEKDLCGAVANGIGEGALSVAGEVSLRQLGVLIKHMDLLVTNDTGAMHIAIATNTRTVSLFCPTEHRALGPAQDLHLHRIVRKDRPCNPCVTKKCKNPFCMEMITVDEVFDAIQELRR